MGIANGLRRLSSALLTLADRMCNVLPAKAGHRGTVALDILAVSTLNVTV